jgi:hypothetical protein
MHQITRSSLSINITHDAPLCNHLIHQPTTQAWASISHDDLALALQLAVAAMAPLLRVLRPAQVCCHAQAACKTSSTLACTDHHAALNTSLRTAVQGNACCLCVANCLAESPTRGARHLQAQSPKKTSNQASIGHATHDDHALRHAQTRCGSATSENAVGNASNRNC